MATSGMKKNASDFIPYCRDQGMPGLCGAAKAGVSIQAASVVMPADGVVTFAGMNMTNMADASYVVLVQNHTDKADPASVDPATKTTLGFTIAGPDAADVLAVVVIGALKGQLTA
jgi:glycine cleavage system aminomethyltransferase T